MSIHEAIRQINAGDQARPDDGRPWNTGLSDATLWVDVRDWLETLASDTAEFPLPKVAPLGIDVTPGMVQEVWDTFVKPDQEKELPQSGEMRVLMAILRSAYVAVGGV